MNETRFLFVGRLTPLCRLDMMLRALAATEGDWRLDVLGDGPQRSGLESLANTLGLTEQVSFHGWVGHEETVAAMRASHWLLAPSVSEGMPLLSLQACSVGLPVLAADAPALRRLVNPGHNGLLVGTGEEDWRAVLQDILQHPGQTMTVQPETPEQDSASAELALFQTLALRYAQSAS